MVWILFDWNCEICVDALGCCIATRNGDMPHIFPGGIPATVLWTLWRLGSLQQQILGSIYYSDIKKYRGEKRKNCCVFPKKKKKKNQVSSGSQIVLARLSPLWNKLVVQIESNLVEKSWLTGASSGQQSSNSTVFSSVRLTPPYNELLPAIWKLKIVFPNSPP